MDNPLQQFLQQPKSVLDYQNDYAQADALKNRNALQSLALQSQQAATAQSVDDRNALQRVAASSGGTREGMIAGLRDSGRASLMAQADALEKSGADLQTAQSVAAKNTADAAKINQGVGQTNYTQAMQKVLSFQSPADATASLNAAVASGKIDMAHATMMAKSIPMNDPVAFDAWKRQWAIGIADPEKMAELMKPHISQFSTGNAQVTQAVDPITLKPTTLSTSAISQSPDSVASTGLGYSRLKEETRHNGVTEGLENTKVLQAGGAGGKMTEDQGKATGWLVQAENAYGNMQGAMKSTPSAAKPGFPDMVAAVPGMGGIANSMRGADRQKFMQGASSLSEALLRAATGAGVNKEEAQQKIQELTPVFGEAQETTDQKMAAIPLYIESLKVRAGPGAPKAAAVLAGNPKPASNVDKPAAPSAGWSVEVVK
jgi:hypothetical protein